MTAVALQRPMAWAEDRALLRSNPSADPGAETGVAPGTCSSPERSLSRHQSPLRDWHQRAKPSRQDAAIPSAGRAPQLANTNRPTFQFPLNQDNLPTRRM